MHLRAEMCVFVDV